MKTKVLKMGWFQCSMGLGEQQHGVTKKRNMNTYLQEPTYLNTGSSFLFMKRLGKGTLFDFGSLLPMQ